ncbi:MAG: hypothetical protein IPH20_24020 [Bacteroidales bacterium]|nr:hypothetical protein [Bacteroidales bacterium]
MRILCNFSMLKSVLFSLFILLLTSCGDKNDDKKDERAPRLRQMNMQYISDDPHWESSDSALFRYNDENQLIAMAGLATVDSISIQYDSEGRISTATFFDDDGVYSIITYSWAGNKMTMTEADYAVAKSVFEVNGDGRIVRMESYFLNEDQWHMVSYVIYNWSEGNLVSTETWQSYSKNGTHQKGSHNFPFMKPELLRLTSGKENLLLLKNDFIKDAEVFYTYDNKNNPFKDLQLYRFSEVAYYSSVNNVLSSIRNGFNISGEVIETYTDDYNFTYNPENYPLIRTESDFSWSITETYLYE